MNPTHAAGHTRQKTHPHTFSDTCGSLMTAERHTHTSCTRRHTCAHCLSSALYWITLIQSALIGLGLSGKMQQQWLRCSRPGMGRKGGSVCVCGVGGLCTIFSSKFNFSGLHGSYLADGAYPVEVYLDHCRCYKPKIDRPYKNSTVPANHVAAENSCVLEKNTSLDGGEIKLNNSKRALDSYMHSVKCVCVCAALINLLKRITVQIEGSFIQISLI